ncbi:MAG: PH domain-containing protein [Spirochaetales bacterium]|nr:PH domain-containing protein [Spirochaetales bacterium]
MIELIEAIRDFLSNLFHALIHLVNRIKKGILEFVRDRIQKKNGVSGFHFRDLNIYRRFKEYLVYMYLKRTITFQKRNCIITWQPFFFVLFKVTAAGIISFCFFSLYPYLSGYLKQGILFFRLHEIFNFDFPTTTFLDNLAKIILCIIIGYTGLFFVKYQVEALLSALIINTNDKKVYYIKNTFLLKELFIFSLPGIDHVVLKQNILSRLLGIGTILLQKKSGERIIIASIKNAPGVFTKLSSAIGPGTGA